MAIPSKIVGAGNNSTAQNVIKVTFSEATSNIPTLEAWDNFSFNSIAHEIFTGTTGNGDIPMLSAVATTDAGPSSDWLPSSATAGGATINRLKGDTNYVNLASSAISASGSVLFNLCWSVPFDASIPSDMEAVLVIRFEYTGPAPVLTWEFNDDDEGGTEGTPVWTTITAGTSGHQIIPTDSGATAGSLMLHRPVSGVIESGEIWVTTS